LFPIESFPRIGAQFVQQAFQSVNQTIGISFS
jgi:hypothetical protein